MPKCAGCGTVILIGGVKGPDGLQYCNRRCVRLGALAVLEREVPEDLVEHHAAAIHAGPCPMCGGPGPVDVHHTHFVWSAIFVTRWSSERLIACGRCALSRQLTTVLGSALLGWWGFPFGLILTPVQVGRGIVEIVAGPSPKRPSQELRDLARKKIAAHAMANPLPPESAAAPPTIRR